MLNWGRNRKQWGREQGELIAFAPRHRFLFRPRFSFRAVVSLTLRTTKRKTHQKTRQPRRLKNCRATCGCLVNFHLGLRGRVTCASVTKISPGHAKIANFFQSPLGLHILNKLWRLGGWRLSFRFCFSYLISVMRQVSTFNIFWYCQIYPSLRLKPKILSRP